MSLRQRWIAGNLAFVSAHRARVVDAFGDGVVKYIEDFVGTPVNSSGEYDDQFTITRVETGTAESTFAPLDGVGGKARITTDDLENDGVNAQLKGEAFRLSVARVLYAGFFGVKLSEATQSDLFLGLAITDTDILGGVTDRIGFQKLDGSTDVKFMIEKDSTETLSAALDTMDTAAHDYEFFYDDDNNQIIVLIDGAEVLRQTTLTNLPDDEELRPSLQFLTGAGASVTMDIDAIRVVQFGKS